MQVQLPHQLLFGGIINLERFRVIATGSERRRDIGLEISLLLLRHVVHVSLWYVSHTDSCWT